MDILNVLKQLRDDIKAWVTNNLNALNTKIDEKTVPIDSELSSTSTNPVQNKAIAKEIDSINDRVGDTPVATQISQAINAQEHFSGDYNDLTNAPDITEDGSGNMVIADESGNIIFKADAEGVHTTAVSLNGEAAATEKYVDDAVANIPTPDVSGQINAHNTSGEAHTDIRQAIEDTKEELSESIVAESNEWKVVDNNGNIIFSVNAEGAHTTELTLNGETAATEVYVDNAIANIDIPEVDFTGYATEKYVDDAIAAIPETDFTGYATEDFVGTAINTAKEELSESIVAESEEWKVVDENGNIIFSVDASGAHTTELTLKEGKAATESYVNSAIHEHNTDQSAHTDIRQAIQSVSDLVGTTAVSEQINTAIADFIEQDPKALEALKELSQALEDHEDAYDALLEAVGSKATKVELEDMKEELSESIVSESDEWKVVDKSGNIIFSVDATGAHTTALTLNGESITGIVDEKVASLVDGAPNTLNTLNKLATALGGVDNRVNDHETRLTEAEDKLDYLYGKHSEGLAYTLSNDGTYYTVKGIGTCADTDVAIPPIYNGLPVTSIDAMAFQSCSSLISVVIPNSVTSIGQGAFSTCENLINIVIPESVTFIDMGLCFYCTSLSNIVIPNSVTIIGQSAFQYCNNLVSVVIPDSVATIGNYAFASCSGLTSVTIPDGVTSIGDGAFENCSNLTNVTMGNSVTSIGAHAFDGCSSLTSIVIPDSVTSIGDYAFYYCSSLTIYCEVSGQPSGWNTAWNSSNRPVVWGAALDFVGVNTQLDDKASKTAANTFTGNNVFTNNNFAIRASGANDDSWITLTNSVTSSSYAFGIRRPYTNYGLQLRYRPDPANQDESRPGDANGTSDIYYDIYHQGNYTKMPAASQSAAGLMSANDKQKLDNTPTFTLNETTLTITTT